MLRRDSRGFRTSEALFLTIWAVLALGCGRSTVHWVSGDRPEAVLSLWKGAASHCSSPRTLVLLASEAGLFGEDIVFADTPSPTLLQQAADAKLLDRVILVVPQPEAPAGSRPQGASAQLKLEVRGFRESAGDWPRGAMLHVDATFFSDGYRAYSRRALLAEAIPKPSDVRRIRRQMEPCLETQLSRLRAHQHPLLLASEAPLLSLQILPPEAPDIDLDRAHYGILAALHGEPIESPGPRNNAERFSFLLEAMAHRDPERAAERTHDLRARGERYFDLDRRVGDYFFHYIGTAPAARFYETLDKLTGTARLEERPVAAPREDAPSVVLITLDTVRADAVGFWNPLARTPALDQLAREAVVYRRAFAPIPQTAPSHASMLTGLHPLSLGMTDNGQRLAADQPTLASLLQSHGYETAAFVSGYPLVAGVSRLDRGFGQYDDEMTDALAPDKRQLVQRRGSETTNRALAWLSQRSQPHRPFFLWVHYYDPHAPYDPPAEFLPKLTGLREFERRQKRLYRAEVRATDHEVGRLLEGLRGERLLDDVILVIAADHGESLGEFGEMFTHGGNVYPVVLHVPLLVRVPGGHEARTIEEPVSVTAVAPTIAALLRVKVPWPMDALPLPGFSELPEAGTSPGLLAITGWGAARVPGGKRQASVIRDGFCFGRDLVSGRTWMLRIEEDPSAPSELPASQSAGIREEMSLLLDSLRNRYAQELPGDLGHLSEEDREKLRSLGYVQ